VDPVILQAKIENSRTTGTNELYNTNANMHAHNAPPQLCWDDTDGVKVRIPALRTSAKVGKVSTISASTSVSFPIELDIHGARIISGM
jgi:hypothetical protein